MNLFGSYMILFGSDLVSFGSNVNFQESSFVLVAGLINFCVKNQVLQVSFKIVAADLMSILSHEFADIIFCESLVIFEYIYI